MHEIIHLVEHTLLHTLEDCVKMLPFLFLSYLMIEFIETRSENKVIEFINKSGRFGPFIGSLLGAVPQCGFSAASAGLYAGGLITRGTLLAVFLSTSDEMLPILISSSAPVSLIIKIITVKILCGIFVGFAVDFIARSTAHVNKVHTGEFCEHEHCGCEHGGILKPALSHTLKVFGFVYVVSFALELVIHYVGQDALADLILNKPVIGEFLAGLVGLIPGCSGSVVITQFYLAGGMRTGAMLSGLLVGSGSGILVLLRNNRHAKDNLFTVAVLYISGALLGLIAGLLPIW